MTHGYVTLADVFAAGRARAASLVPETAGFLALAIGNAVSLFPVCLDEKSVFLALDGKVTATRRGDVIPETEAAKAFRDLLARLLNASVGTMPGLAAAADPRNEVEGDMRSVQRDIEAALVPLNRGAARRALARLARETRRACDEGVPQEARLESPPLHVLPHPPAVDASPIELSRRLQEPWQEDGPARQSNGVPVGPAQARDSAGVLALIDEADGIDVCFEPTPTVIGMPPFDSERESYLTVPTAPNEGGHLSTALLPPYLANPRLDPALPRPSMPTRADELIACFGASHLDDDGMRAAAACLRGIAGVELPGELKHPTWADMHTAPAVFSNRTAPRVVIVPVAPRPVTRGPHERRRPSISLLVATLVLGMAGGAFVVKLRPNLLARFAVDSVVAGVKSAFH